MVGIKELEERIGASIEDIKSDPALAARAVDFYRISPELEAELRNTINQKGAWYDKNRIRPGEPHLPGRAGS